MNYNYYDSSRIVIDKPLKLLVNYRGKGNVYYMYVL